MTSIVKKIETDYENECIQKIGNLIARHSFRFNNEKKLQECIEQLFKANDIEYEREYRLSPQDIIDFRIKYEGGHVGLEIKVDGQRNALLRQINRYLRHDSISSIFVIGTPYWITNLPDTLNEKQIYCFRILSGLI